MYTFILVFAHIFICIYGTRKYVCTDVFMKLAYYIISHQRGDWDMDRETTHDSAIGDASVSQIGILLWSYYDHDNPEHTPLKISMKHNHRGLEDHFPF